MKPGTHVKVHPVPEPEEGDNVTYPFFGTIVDSFELLGMRHVIVKDSKGEQHQVFSTQCEIMNHLQNP